jgi:GDP-L-fucose synthase
VIAALMRKMHEAKTLGAPSVEIWGTGTPRREFIFADDLADACIFVMREYESPDPINIGSGSDLSIRELAELIKKVVGYPGVLHFDTDKPDGAPQKLLDSSRFLNMGWKPRMSLKEGLEKTYGWFLENAGIGTFSAVSA